MLQAGRNERFLLLQLPSEIHFSVRGRVDSFERSRQFDSHVAVATAQRVQALLDLMLLALRVLQAISRGLGLLPSTVDLFQVALLGGRTAVFSLSTRGGMLGEFPIKAPAIGVTFLHQGGQARATSGKFLAASKQLDLQVLNAIGLICDLPLRLRQRFVQS